MIVATPNIVSVKLCIRVYACLNLSIRNIQLVIRTWETYSKSNAPTFTEPVSESKLKIMLMRLKVYMLLEAIMT